MQPHRCRPLKIHAIKIVNPASQNGEEYRVVDENTVYLRYSVDQQDVIINSKPPLENETGWCLRAVAWNSECQLVNLREEPVQIARGHTVQSDETELQKDKATSISYEQEIWINNYKVIFYRRRRAKSIQAKVSLREPELIQNHTVEEPLKADILLEHIAANSTVQFHVSANIDGVPGKAYRIDSPDPKLIDAREQNVTLCIYHPPHSPLMAGDYHLTVEVKADEYPGEMAGDFQIIRVRPFYDHELNFDDDRS